jgi:uncharacterized protein YbaR (Trm112 family)
MASDQKTRDDEEEDALLCVLCNQAFPKISDFVLHCSSKH